ncbi:hypothetical protein [Jatrophihabitans lederbergiae]|uniref:Uncharacterized protein n=1 Tax=Jatrophihabitans lederbergiae TaxID=3075547 RepID=A0ABU2JH88_9ACTN|nr:hypothetical protein [Jatrophihabitans sp. DSM 44399]MDT0264329.1 hypothetical protein [Jatrophihabitans sp. DSM 44399]
MTTTDTTGTAIAIDGHQIWLALFPIAPRAAAPFERDTNHYELLEGVDELMVVTR